MQKLIIALLLLCLSTLMLAKEIDLDKSKGTDQEVIVSLNPTPAQVLFGTTLGFSVFFLTEN